MWKLDEKRRQMGEKKKTLKSSTERLIADRKVTIKKRKKRKYDGFNV